MSSMLSTECTVSHYIPMADKCLADLPLKGKINGIYTKGLLDREDFYKCLSLPFSDQHAFQSKKKLILLDFTGAAMLAIS